MKWCEYCTRFIGLKPLEYLNRVTNFDPQDFNKFRLDGRQKGLLSATTLGKTTLSKITKWQHFKGRLRLYLCHLIIMQNMELLLKMKAGLIDKIARIVKEEKIFLNIKSN